VQQTNKPAAQPAKTTPEEDERKKLELAVGKFGAKPRLKGKMINAIFVTAVCGAFVASVMATGTFRTAFIDIGLVLISLKLAYHLHTEARVNHAQFWIMTAIEDRLLDVMRELRELRKQIRQPPAERQPDAPSDSATAQATDLQKKS